MITFWRNLSWTGRLLFIGLILVGLYRASQA